MRSNRSLPAIGFGVFLLGLLVLLPARVVYRLASPPGVDVSGISGTIWSGLAQEVSINGVYLRDLRWRLRPLRFATANIGYSLEANSAPGFVDADLSVGIGGKLTLESLRASVPVGRFSAASGIAGLRGQATLDFDRIEIVDGFAVAADGRLDLKNLVVPFLSPMSLGSYQADFVTEDDGVTAMIEDTDGVLDLAGSLQIAEDRSFVFLAQAIASPATPKEIVTKLKQYAPADDRGQHELRLEGSL